VSPLRAVLRAKAGDADERSFEEGAEDVAFVRASWKYARGCGPSCSKELPKASEDR